MYSTTRPYLIIPKLIEQPTWGGTYILQLKKWGDKPHLKDKKIGQSYELFGGSKLLLKINDSADETFIPEFGFADREDTEEENFTYKHHVDYCNFADIISENPADILGKKVYEKFGKMPLLNKINHAFGNSFQLHVKPSVTHSHWQPKAESWYYFEDGLVTCGIKDGIEIDEYKQVCHDINNTMKSLSEKVVKGQITLDQAKQESAQFIKEKNPWQFVNTHQIKKYSLLDLSLGGIHHSWEEDREKFPNGNILYEIQQDVMDPVSTIRAFDQGKFKSDGTIREIHIQDYFQYLDRTPEHNDIQNLIRQPRGSKLLSTTNYSLDILEITGQMTHYTNDSFCHLYVRDGAAKIITNDGELNLTRGHSCFIPQSVMKYTIQSKENNSVLLKTYIEI